MTKKKKTLRAKVLASIFAMLICGCSNTVWATEKTSSNFNPVDPGYSIIDTVQNDGSYQGNYMDVVNKAITSTGAADSTENPKIPGHSLVRIGTEANVALNNVYTFKLLNESQEDTGIRIRGVKTDEGWIYNYNFFSQDSGLNGKVNGTTTTLQTLPKATIDYSVLNSPNGIDSDDLQFHIDKVQHYFLTDYAATVAGLESEERVKQDKLLHQDDVNSISNSIKDGTKLSTVLTTYDNKTITATEIDLKDVVYNSITIDGDTISITNSNNNTKTFTDKHITDFDQSIEDYLNKDGTKNNEAGTITSVITTNEKVTVDGQEVYKEYTQTVNISDYVSDAIKNEAKDANVIYNNKTTTIQNAITGIDEEVDKGWNFQVEGNSEQNVKMGDTVKIDSSDKNLTIINEGQTIKFDFSDTPTFNTVTVEQWLDAQAINTNTLTVEQWLDAQAINTNTLTVEQWLDAQAINTDTLTVEQWLETNYATVKEDLAVGNHISTKTIEAKTSVTTPTIVLGQPGSTTNVTYDNTVNNGRITYVDANEQTQQVANLNDGYTYNGDIMKIAEGEDAYAKLNKTISIQGGYKGAEKNLTSENIGIVTTQETYGEDVKMEVKLSESITDLKDITVNGGADGKDGATTVITKDGIGIQGPQGPAGEPGKTVVVEHDKVDVGGNRIEGVADGINPTDAVNVRQLNKLSGRVDKVGAGAAALAALHPLDFDPDDKLSFSAGVGNYGGETATALGMFYRPTEKVMLSAAGTMGNGENMVNMGVTFALDKTNNVSNSRVAMAREIQDLREQVAALTALVTQLAGRNNPALQDVVMFPDVPENHWAYDYIEGLQKRGIVEGYPDGNFAGDRSMTRYEYAAMLYRALEKGFPVDTRLLDEFEAELGRIRIDRIKGLDDDANKVERVRVNQYEDRDDYGSKLVAVNAVKQ